MLELGLIALVNSANTRLARSALPDSPIVPDRPPGRLRLVTAVALHRVATRLHRLATRLDHGRLSPLRSGQPA